MKSRTIPQELEGAERDMALVIADLRNLLTTEHKRATAPRIALSYLLSHLGTRLRARTDPRYLPLTVYVAREGQRVVTLCYRKHRDPTSLQIAFDSEVEEA